MDQIFDYAKASANPSKLPPNMTNDPNNLLEKPGCMAPTFIQEKILPLVRDEIEKKRGEKYQSTSSPITWKQFIDSYVTSPKPKIERLGDSLNDAPFLDKVRLTISERAAQKGYFEKATRRSTTEGYKVFGNQFIQERGSISKSCDSFFETRPRESFCH